MKKFLLEQDRASSPLELICIRCAMAELVPGYNFKTDGPPLRHCDRCRRLYRNWALPADEADKLPDNPYNPGWYDHICEEDFRQAFREAGHNADDLVFTYEPWERRERLWDRNKHLPEDHVHIQFSSPNEIMFCDVVTRPKPNTFTVRVHGFSVFCPAIWDGRLYLASWDGKTIHGNTGRPMLTVVRPLPYVKKIQKSIEPLPWARSIPLAN